MRIAIANWSARRVGGIEEYLSLIMPALHNAGHELLLWHDVDEPKTRERIDVPPGTVQLCSAALGSPQAVQALREWRADVIYGHGLLDPFAERDLVEVAPSVRFVHTYSGTCISGGKTFTRPVNSACERTFGWPCLLHYLPRGCGGRNPWTMVREFERQSAVLETLRTYRRVLTHSAHMCSELTRHRVDADVIPFPVCGGAPMSDDCPNDRWHLVFAGRMDPLKGARLLVEAAPIVARAARRPLRVTLAGDGSERTALESRAKSETSSDVEFVFTGWLEREGVQALLRTADLLVVPIIPTRRWRHRQAGL